MFQGSARRLVRIAAVLIVISGFAVAGAARPIRADDGFISINGFAFNPNSVTVQVGDTVTWSNDQNVPHTVSADDGSFDLGVLQPGEAASLTFVNAGTFTYHCNIHPTMTAAIVVTDGQ